MRMPTVTLNDWERIGCTLDDGPAHGRRIGLIVLAGDAAIEPELKRYLTLSGLEIYTTRIRLPRQFSPEGLDRMAEEIQDATRLILPGEQLELVAFGCTSGSVALGTDRLAREISAARPGMGAADPISAAIFACKTLGLHRIALLTPYADDRNKSLRDFLTTQGIEPVLCATFRAKTALRLGHTPPNHVPPSVIAEAAGKLLEADVQGVFISCTGLRCAQIIEPLERQFGKPIVASNQALAWYLRERLVPDAPIGGVGVLFSARMDQPVGDCKI